MTFDENALLDALVRNAELPWVLSRLELVSPEDGEVIAYEPVLPYRDGVRIGPLGGIDQLVPFAPYDAIYREAEQRDRYVVRDNL